MNLLKILANPTKQVKATMQKARRRVQAFAKSIKQGKLDKKNTTYQDIQDYLKNAPKKYRRYNRKIGAYEPITPRGKEKQTDEFADFFLKLNKMINEGRNAQEEIERQTMKKDYHLSEAVLDLMESRGMSIDEYDSDSDNAKQLHLENAMDYYNIDKLNQEQMEKISQITNNLDNYNLRDIYDGVFAIHNTTESGAVFSEI